MQSDKTGVGAGAALHRVASWVTFGQTQVKEGNMPCEHMYGEHSEGRKVQWVKNSVQGSSEPCKLQFGWKVEISYPVIDL